MRRALVSPSGSRDWSTATDKLYLHKISLRLRLNTRILGYAGSDRILHHTFPSNCLLYIWRLFIADYHSAILNEHIANEYLLALFEIRFIPKRQHFSITTMQQMLQEECWSRRDFQYKVVARIYSLINFNSDSNFIRAKCIWDYYPVKQIGRNMKLVFRISASSSLITWLAKAPEEMSLQKAQ